MWFYRVNFWPLKALKTSSMKFGQSKLPRSVQVQGTWYTLKMGNHLPNPDEFIPQNLSLAKFLRESAQLGLLTLLKAVHILDQWKRSSKDWNFLGVKWKKYFTRPQRTPLAINEIQRDGNALRHLITHSTHHSLLWIQSDLEICIYGKSDRWTVWEGFVSVFVSFGSPFVHRLRLSFSTSFSLGRRLLMA